MWRTRSELEKSMIEGENGPKVYRQKASEYTSLCSEMRSFLRVAASIAPVVQGIFNDAEIMSEEKDSAQLQLTLAQLKSFAVSALSFRQKILTKFSSFVDISMTFLQAVNIFVCALYEACGIIESVERRRELRISTAFPMNFQLKLSEQGLESLELLSWASRDASPMPLRLKAAVVRHRVSLCIDPLYDLEWIRRQWQKWSVFWCFPDTTRCHNDPITIPLFEQSHTTRGILKLPEVVS
ncbi:unnamed protein product [Strongylus vulgaris]|uniref:Uncharacterized protein n=1 Tax=Strongylus vulgaris TaxID=40348 RepID=A0A3P7J115_STRVU|nr:unnamed protein product [Strongylus vulgaris]